MSTKHSHPKFSFPYNVIRNISAPEDKENGREVYSGNAPISSFLSLSNDENVRDYMLEVEGKARQVPTQVHRAIRDTLKNAPHNFTVLNSGIVIAAHVAEVDDKNRLAHLTGASILNGAQTQGELKRYVSAQKHQGVDPAPVNLKYELIVTKDPSLIGEISIARNFQNDVLSISIAGRLGELDELKKAFERKSGSDKTLRLSETDLGDGFVLTEKLLQVIAALIPEELWISDDEKGDPNKAYTYSMKARCLKEFRKIYEEKANENNPDQKRYKDLYQFYLDIAGEAWDLYETWKAHNGFYGKRIRAIDRGKYGEVTEVSDGLVFPIIAAYSSFIRKTKKGWVVEVPKGFQEQVLIDAAIDAYKNIAFSNPNAMGKNRACYSYLSRFTSFVRNMSDSKQ